MAGVELVMGVLTFAIGASVGSFLNVVADRVPAGRSIVKPRSRCESCNRQLGSREMFPVFSYLLLRGRCRTCEAAIPARVVATELMGGLLFAALYLRYGFGTEFVIVGAAVSMLLVIGLIDLEHGLILNRIVFPSIVVLLVLSPFWTELGLSRPFFGSEGFLASALNSLVTGAGSFAAFLAIWLAYPSGMGAGDVKLGAVVGLLVGFPAVLLALWLAVVTGGLTAILLLVLGKKGRKDPIPFGPFLSLGGIVVMLAGGSVVDDVIRFATGL